MKVVIEKGSRIRNVKCANHFVETSSVKNEKIASFSPELHQHSQPLDQKVLRPFRNFCYKQLVRKAISVIDYKLFHDAAFIKVLVLNVLHYIVESWCCAMAVVNYF